MQTRPLIGVIACRREIEGHPAHMVTDKYLTALREYGLEPVLLPVWSGVEPERPASLLSNFDGLLLTGSYTNVLPERYGDSRAAENTRDDRERDASALAFIPAALDMGLPLFGICRGFQELNVAFGGSLHQVVQDEPGMLDHREPAGDKAAHYAPSHDLEILANGRLAALFDARMTRVNSLHQQGIKRLGPGLTAEALAPDGLIEAISVTDAKAFAMGVQWHPEWESQQHPLYDALFRGFSSSCLAYQAQRHATAVGV